MKPVSDSLHHHTPEEERRIREAALDKTLADTFPASDPLSTDPNPDDDAAVEQSSSSPDGVCSPRPGDRPPDE